MEGQRLGQFNSVPWYSQGPIDEVPMPVLGPDIVDPRQAAVLRAEAERPAPEPEPEPEG